MATASGTSAGTTLTTFDKALKEYYLPEILVQFNSDTVYYMRLAKSTQNILGREVVRSLNVNRNESFAAVASGGSLPEPHNQGYVDMRYKWKRLYSRILVDGEIIAASKSDAGAFASALDSEINGSVRDGKNEVNRQLCNDGSGRLGIVSSIVSTGASSVIGVREVFDIPDQAGKLRWLRPGMWLSFVDASAAAGATSFLHNSNVYQFQVTAVNPRAKTITVAADTSALSAALAAGDALVRHHYRESTTTNATANTNFRGGNTSTLVANDGRELMGLAGLVDDGNVFYDYGGGAEFYTPLQGIDSSSYPFWQANVFDGGGSTQPLDINLMQTAQDDQEEIGQGQLSAVVTSYGGRRAYEQLLINDKRYVNTMELDGGYKALSFNGVPLFPEKDCPTGHFFFLDESTLMMDRLSDWFWLDKDGAILSRLPDRDAYQATLAMYCEHSITRRNSNSVLKEVAEG